MTPSAPRRRGGRDVSGLIAFAIAAGIVRILEGKDRFKP